MGLAYIESADAANLPMAKEVCEILHVAYPNHSWWVRIDGGILVIKNQSISGTIGMVRHMSMIAHDAGARKRDIILAAGELLERANMRRGAYTGEPVKSFEAPKSLKWRPQLFTPKVIH